MRVVIAEDQVLLRAGLGRLFADGGHEVVASLGDADSLPAAVSATEPGPRGGRHPDAADLHRRGRPRGPRAQTAHPDLGVLVLSQHVETTHTIDLIPLAGFGYLLKDRVLEVGDFLSAAERVARGGSALDPHVVATLLSGRRGDDPLAALTERERTVLQLMAEGLTNTGIAKRLHLSERTVEAHVRHLLTKLDLPDSEDDHRRVHAVLAHLSAAQS